MSVSTLARSFRLTGVGDGVGDEVDLVALGRDLETTPYRPVRFLAQGGMGQVVVVDHTGLGRRSVMKLLRSQLAGGAREADLEARLRAEGRVLARLSHPGLVQVLDAGATASGRPYVVTELLAGRTLREHLDAHCGALRVSEALDFIGQVLAALAVVHDAGFVHRDLKPANVFVVEGQGGEPPRIKVLDFGVAKPESAADRAALGLLQPTAENTVVGTPISVSPEQVRGARVDARTDVYGCGVLLFRMVVGRYPFAGSMADLFRKHLQEAPPVPSAVARSAIPAEVDAVVLRALAKAPADRFADARSMLAAVDAARAACASPPARVAAAGDDAGPTPAALPITEPGDTTTIHGTRFQLAPTDGEATVLFSMRATGSPSPPVLVVASRDDGTQEPGTRDLLAAWWPVVAALALAAVLILAVSAWSFR